MGSEYRYPATPSLHLCIYNASVNEVARKLLPDLNVCNVVTSSI